MDSVLSFNSITVVPAILISAYIGHWLCAVKGWGVDSFMAYYVLIPLALVLPQSTLGVPDHYSTDVQNFTYFMFWCWLGVFVGALLSLNKRIPRIYYLALVAREDCDFDGKRYDSDDVVHVNHYANAKEQKRAVIKIDESGVFREHGTSLRPTGWTEHIFSKEELRKVYIDSGTINENRMLTTYVRYDDVHELVDAIGLNEQQKIATEQFFWNPVKWKRTKKKLVDKRNRQQDT